MKKRKSFVNKKKKGADAGAGGDEDVKGDDILSPLLVSDSLEGGEGESNSNSNNNSSSIPSIDNDDSNSLPLQPSNPLIPAAAAG